VPQPLSDAPEFLNILWYGEGGTGKTTDLCSMAKLGKIWVANAESGLKARALRSHGIPIENIEVFPGPGEVISYDGLEKEYFRIREELHNDPTAYVGVGWDSITEIQQALKDIAVEGSVARAHRAGRERSRWVVDQDNWREVNEQCRQLVRRFRDLPCHFGATALSRREQDGSSQVTYQPGVTPGLQNDLVGWVDMVCHCSMSIVDGDEEYVGLFRPHGLYRGKDRDRTMPKWVINPTFDRVLEFDQGGLTLDDDPVTQLARERRARAEAAATAAA
jgi:hypothetical protein